MIPEQFRWDQVRRMAGLDGYPKKEPEAEAELVIVAGKVGRSEAHLQGVIDEVMAVWTKCPKPAELRGLLLMAQHSFRDMDCTFCGGSGWRIVERESVSGAERCACGSVPLPSGRGVPYRKVRRDKGDGLTQAKLDWVQ